MAEDDEPSIGEDLARELAKAIRERDEAREQVRALTEQLAEAKLAGDLEHEGRMAAQEQVRSLTVERDEAKAWASSTAELHEQNLARLVEAGARLSRAREALAALVPCDDGRCPDHPPDFSPEKWATLRVTLEEEV